jgi:hypothetical protein
MFYTKDTRKPRTRKPANNVRLTRDLSESTSIVLDVRDILKGLAQNPVAEGREDFWDNFDGNLEQVEKFISSRKPKADFLDQITGLKSLSWCEDSDVYPPALEVAYKSFVVAFMRECMTLVSADSADYWGLVGLFTTFEKNPGAFCEAKQAVAATA